MSYFLDDKCQIKSREHDYENRIDGGTNASSESELTRGPEGCREVAGGEECGDDTPGERPWLITTLKGSRN